LALFNKVILHIIFKISIVSWKKDIVFNTGEYRVSFKRSIPFFHKKNKKKQKIVNQNQLFVVNYYITRAKNILSKRR